MLVEIIREEVGRFMDFLIEQAKSELRAQGHVNTGRSLDQIRQEIEVSLTAPTVARIYVPDHLVILDKGIRPSRVPYSPGSGARDSRYIAGLMEWLATKGGGTQKERLGRALSIAATAKKTGHPTPGSMKYSSNGRRTNWSQHAIDANVNRGAEFIDFLRITNEIVRKFEQEVNAAA